MKEETKRQGSPPEHLDENELAQYAEYLRHETPHIPERLAAHVESCSYCRAELMAITDMLGELPDLAEEPIAPILAAPPGWSRKPLFTGKRLLRSAAAVAAIFLLSWGVLQVLPDRPMREPVAGTTDKNKMTPENRGIASREHPEKDSSATAVVASDTVLYASAYVPDPALESLVNARYRSGRDPGVAGPDRGSVFAPGDTLRISWSEGTKDEFMMDILDNRGNRMQRITAGKAARIDWKIDLKPGLYYWKFVGKDELWKVGRFRVITGSVHPGGGLR
jgi:hypothetical protein